MFFTKKTCYKANGVIFTPRALAPRIQAPVGYSVPEYIDGLSYFTPVDNQLENPWCLAYATCALIERRNWQLTGICKQLNPEPLYIESKLNDGDPRPGTTVLSMIKAVRSLRYISEDTPLIYLDTADEYRFAVHKYGAAVCVFNITQGWNSCSRLNGMIGDDNVPLGGHAVCGGYYDKFSAGGPNQWGVGWGWQGYWRMTWEQFKQQFDSGFVFDIQE